MTRKKFKIIPSSTSIPYKCKEGEMLIMNSQGVFFIVKYINDYDGNLIQKLSDAIGNYDVEWKED